MENDTCWRSRINDRLDYRLSLWLIMSVFVIVIAIDAVCYRYSYMLMQKVVEFSIPSSSLSDVNSMNYGDLPGDQVRYVYMVCYRGWYGVLNEMKDRYVAGWADERVGLALEDAYNALLNAFSTVNSSAGLSLCVCVYSTHALKLGTPTS